MRALVLFREGLRDRRDIFCSGLEKLGYRCERAILAPARDDVLVIWNRYGTSDYEARKFEAVGARVIVTENGHLGKTWRGGSWYAMALGHHAGAGFWKNGGPQRWDSWAVALEPWRINKGPLLILAQRGIGEAGIASPPSWAEKTLGRLRENGISARIRQHPEARGITTPPPPLIDELIDISAVVAWHSAAAANALMLGVPVWYDCPTWLGRDAALPLSALLKNPETEPKRDIADRLNMFRNLAWGMWENEEIARGDPYKHLLQ